MYCSNNCIKWKNNTCDGDSFCQRKYKLDFLFDRSLLAIKQREHVDLYLDRDGCDKEAFTTLKSIEKNVLNFVQEGKNLYIHSTISGNGKSSWAVRLLQSYFNKIWASTDLDCRGLFVHIPRYLLSIKDAISEKNEYASHIKENILNADLVVFDEIGTKSITTFECENLLNIISARIDSGKSNVYTSNLTPSDLREKLGDRLYSRIVNLSTDIELFGRDKRILVK